MQTPTKQADRPHHSPKPIPNPRGTQTIPQPKPTLPRTPDGRFAPEFHPTLPLQPDRISKGEEFP
jgi:hypothetical protein